MTFGLDFALILAVVIVLSLGLLGIGGAILTLPLLVYAAGIPFQKAVAAAYAAWDQGKF